MKTLAQEWLEYRNRVYPAGGLDMEQNKQLHMAYFAGALSALSLAIEKTDGMTAEARYQNGMALINEVKATCQAIIIRGRQKN